VSNRVKTLFLHLISFFTDALFPIPKAEQWIFNTPKEEIFKILPRAFVSPIPESFGVFSYKDEHVQRLIWAIKYKKSKQASIIAGFALHRFIKIFAQVLPTDETLPVANESQKIIVIPMPVSKQRRRERGFNQCELLTAEIKRLENAESYKIIIVNNLLIRSRHTSRQTLKDKSHREESTEGLFKVDGKILDSKFKNMTFIIIDDVVTTGSTMKEAVSTMRKAGFTSTWGLSVAH